MESIIWVELREEGRLVAMSQLAKIERKPFGVGSEELDAGRPFLQDAVIAGHDCDEISILIYPNLPVCSEIVGSEFDGKALCDHPLIVERLRCCLQAHKP